MISDQFLASTQPYILCADDFGLTHGIAEGILNLASIGTIGATSIMIESLILPKYSSRLDYCNIQKGLHFNLTEELIKSGFSMKDLLIHISISKEIQNEVVKRLKEQLQKFEDVFGQIPDFIDGHRHIHVFPTIRCLFLNEIKERYGSLKKKPWIRQIRNTLSLTDSKWKSVTLTMLNMGFRNQCEQAGFMTNQAFSGIYSFADEANYQRLLKQWQEDACKGTLIMCHPSSIYESSDPISRARVKEYEILKLQTDLC